MGKIGLGNPEISWWIIHFPQLFTWQFWEYHRPPTVGPKSKITPQNHSETLLVHPFEGNLDGQAVEMEVVHRGHVAKLPMLRSWWVH